MTDSVKKSLYIYHTDVANIKPNEIYSCAKWLVSIGRYWFVNSAYVDLIKLQYSYPERFRKIMADYYEQHDREKVNKVIRDVQPYRTFIGAYGDDPHMYYHADNIR